MSNMYAKLVNYIRTLCNMQGVLVTTDGSHGKNRRRFKCQHQEPH